MMHRSQGEISAADFTAEFAAAMRRLALPQHVPLIAHAALSTFGQIQGGADTLVAALLAMRPALMMPVFTYKTMLTPEVGPPDNGMSYGLAFDRNQQAEFFSPDLPADRLMGRVPESLRRHPRARRSMHPILSFAGVNVEQALAAQSLAQPLAPIGALLAQDGWVLLLGVDHSVNTSIHYAEWLCGRRAFTRWALTEQGVLECPNFPGCSDGFTVLADDLDADTHSAWLGNGRIHALPLSAIMRAVAERLADDRLALLCHHSYCERCRAFEQFQRNSSSTAAQGR